MRAPNLGDGNWRAVRPSYETETVVYGDLHVHVRSATAVRGSKLIVPGERDATGPLSLLSPSVCSLPPSVPVPPSAPVSLCLGIRLGSQQQHTRRPHGVGGVALAVLLSRVSGPVRLTY